MEFSIKVHDWSQASTGLSEAKTASKASVHDCLVVGVFSKASGNAANGATSAVAKKASVSGATKALQEPLFGAAAYVDQHTQGFITRLIEEGDFSGALQTTLMLHSVSDVFAKRVLLVGCGAKETYSATAHAKAAGAAWKTLFATQIDDVLWALPAFTLPSVEAKDDETEAKMAQAVRAVVKSAFAQAYQFNQMKSQPEPALHLPAKITLALDENAAALKTSFAKIAQQAVEQSMAEAEGIRFARDLANLPGNVCTPTYLAEAAKELASEFDLKLEVLSQKQIEALRMGSFLSVAKGSVEPPKFIVIRHLGAAEKDAPIVLVGKGITFDSGGISLKPGEAMDEMKYDMCGAASVLGTLRAVARMKLKLNVIGVIPTCENMPSSKASKPGDIVKSMSGQTIEVLNTDAEGRLILCDALTYVERLKPAAVIDIATLTGACVIALGNHHSGLFAREEDNDLAQALILAGQEAADSVWRMPLDEEYQEQLKSNFADMANIGGRPAGSVTAACFLARFTKAYPWAHLDIAGTAWKGGKEKGATGRPVGLLTQFLVQKAAS